MVITVTRKGMLDNIPIILSLHSLRIPAEEEMVPLRSHLYFKG